LEKVERMFTGLVEALVPVQAVLDDPPGRTLVIAGGPLTAGCQIGDSIAINGCCLTVLTLDETTWTFAAGPETLARTNLGRLQPGDLVNVERSLKLGDRIGGHLVTGHVDAVGSLASRDDSGAWAICWFHMPTSLGRQMISKGSITVDGVSLTLVEVEAERFSVMLIPHTLSVTTLGRLRPGDPVNLETDLLAKYVEKQLLSRTG